MPDLTPMTRQEKFLNGDTDLEPITRREYFYAGRESELPEGHQEPETREEWFIKEYRGGGGGDITVESLSVTSNGTYTAPSGKAYSPVEVNVPLPENTYLLKSVANLPQAIASFNDGQDMVMPSLKVAIEPQQEGSGDPSPTNIRPISGWSNCVISVANAITDPTVEQTYTIDLDGTRYGGELDVVNGVLTVDMASVDLGTLKYSYYSGNLFTASISNLKPVSNERLCNALCSIYVAKQGNEYASIDGSFVAGFNSASTLAIHDSRFTDATSFKTAMDGVKLVYELDTPLTIHLTPTQVKSLLGSNNVWADTGDIKDAEYFSKEV